MHRPSNRGLRWLRRLVVAGAALAAIVGCVIGVAPLLVDSESVKRAVERQFTQSAGGEATYESASLKLFPRPGVALSGLTVRVPSVSGRIAALQVGVAWLPLLYGEVRPTAVRIERPVLQVRIATGAAADIRVSADLGPLADGLARDVADMSIAIEEGEISVAYGERQVSLSGLDVSADISVADDRSAIRASLRARRRVRQSPVPIEHSNWVRSASHSTPAETKMGWCSSCATSAPAS